VPRTEAKGSSSGANPPGDAISWRLPGVFVFFGRLTRAMRVVLYERVVCMKLKDMMKYVLQNGTLALESKVQAEGVVALAEKSGYHFGYDTFPSGVFEVYNKDRPDLQEAEAGMDPLAEVHVQDFLDARTPDEVWSAISGMHKAGLQRLLLHLHRRLVPIYESVRVEVVIEASNTPDGGKVRLVDTIRSATAPTLVQALAVVQETCSLPWPVVGEGFVASEWVTVDDRYVRRKASFTGMKPISKGDLEEAGHRLCV